MTNTDKFSLSIASSNYTDAPPNILEYYSADLDSYENFTQAKTDFNTKTYKAFLDSIPNEAKHLFTPVTNSLTSTQQEQPIVQLVKEEKIHWGGDNQTGDRPNAIRHSGTVSKAFTFNQVATWYANTCSNYDEALQSEATKYLSGDIQRVKAGIMVYDVLCNQIYETHSLYNVRAAMRRETEEQENLYQFNKFKSIIAPLHESNDIVAVQESLDFKALRTADWCFKKYAMPSDKTSINGTPGSKISIILDTSVAKETTLLDTPSISEHSYLKKTSCFSIKIKGKHVLLVVLHMKNPKDTAAQVSADLKVLIELLKRQTKLPYDFVIVTGDTNLESKNNYMPSQLSTSLGLKKVDNISPTTCKKRTWAQGQVTKADVEGLDEKDFIAHSNNLNPVRHTLYPDDSNSGVYPSLTVSYLPKPDWPSDHKALTALFEEV